MHSYCLVLEGFLEAATALLSRCSLLYLQVSELRASRGLRKPKGAEGVVRFQQPANGHCRLSQAKEKADCVCVCLKRPDKSALVF